MNSRGLAQWRATGGEEGAAILGKQDLENVTESKALGSWQGKELYNFTSKRFFRYAIEKHELEHGHHDHGHGHHEHHPSLLFACVSGVLNYFLMYSLCCSYGMVMFADDFNSQHRGLGIKLNLMNGLLVGLLVSTKSKIPVAMAGPDLNPVIFLGEFVSRISEEIAKQLDLNYPGDRRRLEVCEESFFSSPLRWLGASSSDEEFCTGYHLASHEEDCIEYHEQLRATTLFAVSMSSLLLAIVFLLMGRLEWTTKLANFVPINIMEAYLACIGCKAFKYALKFVKYDARQFMPAALIGVPLYFLKRYHIGSPAVVIPCMLLIPLGIYYIVLFASGSDIDVARKNNHMFPKVDDVDFWILWTDGLYGKIGKINLKAWLKTWLDLLIMIVVCVLDNVLIGLSTTENKMPVKVDKDYEIQLHGLGNIMTALASASAGYMNFEFNFINFGVMGNTKDRRGGIICAILCGISFMITLQHFNYMPRAFLSAILFFAGSGFIAENLWGSRLYLGLDEWLQVVMVLMVFIITNNLLWSVGAGALMVGFSFVVRYARVSCTNGPPSFGNEVLCCERRFQPVQATVQHIAGKWLLVVRLKGFVFFASITRLVTLLHKELNNLDNVDEFLRLRFIIFDLEYLDEFDSSTVKSLLKFAKSAKEKHIRCVFSSVDAETEEKLRTKGLLQEDEVCFLDLDEAVLYVHHHILAYRQKLQERWTDCSFALQLGQHLHVEHLEYEPFEAPFSSFDCQFNGRWDYCEMVKIKGYKTELWRPGEEGRELFLIHSGAVALFEELPSKQNAYDIKTMAPLAVYRHGWFLNREALMKGATRFCAVAIEDGQLIAWTMNSWERMSRERPWMTCRIMEEVMSQAQEDVERTAEALMQSKEAFAFSGDQGKVAEMEFLRESVTASRGVRSVRNKDASSNLSLFALQSDSVGGLFPPLPGVKAALYLEHRGFFKEFDGEGILPALPKHIYHSLQQAFENYATRGRNGAELSWERVMDALKFAGLFDIVLADVTRGPLTMMEFIILGHEAAFARLSPEMVAEAEAIYDELDVNKDGRVSFDEAFSLLSKLFATTPITHENLKGMAKEWAANHGIFLTKQAITQLLSRFVQRFGIYWLLVDGLREMFDLPRSLKELSSEDMALPQSVPSDKVFAPEVLKKLGLSEEELSEILWASGCCGDSHPQDVLAFDFHSLIQATRIYMGNVQTDLPPFPTRMLTEIRASSKQAYHGTDIGSPPPSDGNAVVSPSPDAPPPSAETEQPAESPTIAEASPGPSATGEAEASPGPSATGEAEASPGPSAAVAPGDGSESMMMGSLPLTAMESGMEPTATELGSGEKKKRIKSRKTKTKSGVMKSDSEAKLASSTSLQSITESQSEENVGQTTTMEGATENQPLVASILERVTESQPFTGPIGSGTEVKPVPNAGSIKDIIVDYRKLAKLRARELSKGDPLSKVPHMSENLMVIGGCDLKTQARKRLTNFFGPGQAEVVELTPTEKALEDLDSLSCRAKIFIMMETEDTATGKQISNIMGALIVLNLLVMIVKPLICSPGSKCEKGKVWKIIEAFFSAIFTIEYLVRFSVCNALTDDNMEFLRFVKRPGNLCDLFSVLPFYFSVITSGGGGGAASILKVVRLFKLTRIMKGMRLLAVVPKSVQAILPPILVLLLVIWGIYMKEIEFGKAAKK